MAGNDNSADVLSVKELTETRTRFRQEEMQHGLKWHDVMQMEKYMDNGDWAKLHRMQQRHDLEAAQKTTDTQFGKLTIGDDKHGGRTGERAGESLARKADDGPGRGDTIRVPSGRGYIEINAGPGCGERATVNDRDIKNDQRRVNETARPDRDNSDHASDAKSDRSHLNEKTDPTQDRSNHNSDAKNDQSRVYSGYDVKNDQSRVQKFGEQSKIGY